MQPDHNHHTPNLPICQPQLPTPPEGRVGALLDSLCRKSPPASSPYLTRSPAARRIHRFYHRLSSGLTLPGNYRMLTLTSSPDSPPDINRSFQLLRQRLTRRGIPIHYIAVKEYTQSGLLHLHIIARSKFIPDGLVSKLWDDIHHARIVSIKRLSHRRKLASYMAKYLRKEASRFWLSQAWLPHEWRRFWLKLLRFAYSLNLPRWWTTRVWKDWLQGDPFTVTDTRPASQYIDRMSLLTHLGYWDLFPRRREAAQWYRSWADPFIYGNPEAAVPAEAPPPPPSSPGPYIQAGGLDV